MNAAAKNKVLLLLGMEQSLKDILQDSVPENLIILQCYHPVLLQPFDDLMRDILIAVYRENVGEIIVAASKGAFIEKGNLYKKIVENKGLDELKALEYLFKNTTPEFPARSIQEWLEGGNTLMDRVQHTVKMIQHHPLLPSYIKVRGLSFDNQTQIKFFDNKAM